MRAVSHRPDLIATHVMRANGFDAVGSTTSDAKQGGSSDAEILSKIFFSKGEPFQPVFARSWVDNDQEGLRPPY